MGAYVVNFCAKDSDRYLYIAARCQHWLPNERNRDGNGWLLVHDVFSQMKSAELVVPTCPSASWLQAPNTSARCTRKGGRMRRASRTRGPCSEPNCWCSGLEGGTLENCWKLDGGLNARYIACTSNFMYVTLNVNQIECTSN